jgi:hypothetical protein
MIVAKFKVQSVTTYEGGSETVELSAVHGPGNETWSKFTPSGKLSITISNPDAVGQLKVGASYLLTFAPA